MKLVYALLALLGAIFVLCFLNWKHLRWLSSSLHRAHIISYASPTHQHSVESRRTQEVLRRAHERNSS